MKPYILACLLLINTEPSLGQNIFFCSQITCGSDCVSPCGWSSLFNACLLGYHTSPSEKTKGSGCTTPVPHGMGMGMGMGHATLPKTSETTTSPTTSETTTSPTTSETTTSPTTSETTTSPTTSETTTSPTTSETTTSPTTSETTSSPTTTLTTSTTPTATSLTSQFITSETLNVSEIVVPIVVTLCAILLIFLVGNYYRRRQSHILEESQKEEEIEYAEADEQYNDESQQMYLEPVLLKNQGITRNQKTNKQVIVNPNYNPDDNDYEYVSSNELPITDREYELSDNQLQFNAEGMYDFATATENKNP